MMVCPAPMPTVLHGGGAESGKRPEMSVANVAVTQLPPAGAQQDWQTLGVVTWTGSCLVAGER